MAPMHAKNLERPDETRRFPKGWMAFQFDDFTIFRGVLEPGWRWSKHVKPIAGTTRRQIERTDYLVSWRLHIQLDDGTETEFGPGDVYRIPPGHDGWVVGDEPVVSFEFAGAAEFAKPSAVSRSDVFAPGHSERSRAISCVVGSAEEIPRLRCCEKWPGLANKLAIFMPWGRRWRHEVSE